MRIVKDSLDSLSSVFSQRMTFSSFVSPCVAVSLNLSQFFIRVVLVLFELCDLLFCVFEVVLDSPHADGVELTKALLSFQLRLKVSDEFIVVFDLRSV